MRKETVDTYIGIKDIQIIKKDKSQTGKTLTGEIINPFKTHIEFKDKFATPLVIDYDDILSIKLLKFSKSTGDEDGL